MHNVSIHHHKYIYHLSDHPKQNFAFISSATNHLLSLDNKVPLIHLKCGPCSTQHKCKHVFGKCMGLAIMKDVSVILHYGISGHGKGLVDAASGFGVKGPLRKAVVTKDLPYENANNIVTFLKENVRNFQKLK